MVMRIVQGIAMWMLMQFVMKQFMGAGKQTAEVKDAQGNVVQVPANTGKIPPYASRPSRLDEGAVYNPMPQMIAPIWPDNSYVDVVVTISPSFLRTPPQRDRLRDLKRLSTIDDDDFLATNLGYAVFGLADLVRAPDKLAGANPFDNRGIDYAANRGPLDTPAIDARIARVAREPFATLRLREVSDLRGAGRVPIVSLHTSGD